MISDTQPGMLFTPEGNVHVCLDFDDAADLGKGSTLSRRGGQRHDAGARQPGAEAPASRRRGSKNVRHGLRGRGGRREGFEP